MNLNYDQEPIIVPPGGGSKYMIEGGSIVHKINSNNTSGNFSVVEIVSPPGSGIDLHVHENEDEIVSLLEGEIEVELDGKKIKAEPGAMAFLPKGIPHGFINIGKKPSRLSVTFLPGNFDNFFIELANLYKNGLQTTEQVTNLTHKYGFNYM